jgi:hypothetical protein
VSAGIYDDMNPDWPEALPGWEPWEEDYEVMQIEEGGCEYCGAPDVRDNPEPFGGKSCCDGCFNMLIGDERDAPPWRCGNASTPYPDHPT